MSEQTIKRLPASADPETRLFIRQAIESATIQIARRMRELEGSVRALGGGEAPDISVVETAADMPVAVRGGACFVLDAGKWYYCVLDSIWSEQPSGGGSGLDLALLGTARFERHIQIPVTHVGNAAEQPTPVAVYTAGGDQYSTTGAKYGYCQWEVPNDWDGADIYFEIDWLPDSGAISGTDTIEWTVEYRAIAEGEAINNGSSRTLTATDSADYSQYATKHSRFTLAFNDANQPLTKQDHIYFKISRNTGVANDFGGSVVVTAYEVIYTSIGFPTSN